MKPEQAAQSLLTQTAAPLSTTVTGYTMFLIQADAANTGTVYIGTADRQLYSLAKGVSVWWGPCAASEVYIKSSLASGDKITASYFAA